jgi:hypothetical protein
MTYRVVKQSTGETFAAFALHHYHQAVAAALDAAAISGEPFVIYTSMLYDPEVRAAESRLLYTTPPSSSAPLADRWRRRTWRWQWIEL